MKDFKLPPLRDNEFFSYHYLRDKNGDPWAVSFCLELRYGMAVVRTEKAISFEEAHAARFDLLRFQILEQLTLLRAISPSEQDDE